MAVLVASGSAVSVAGNAKSADLVSGQYQFGGAGIYTLISKCSATGMNVTFAVGGITLANDLAVTFTGTAGTITAKDNIIASQKMNGGRVELTFRNTTGGAVTADYQIWFEPLR